MFYPKSLRGENKQDMGFIVSYLQLVKRALLLKIIASEVSLSRFEHLLVM